MNKDVIAVHFVLPCKYSQGIWKIGKVIRIKFHPPHDSISLNLLVYKTKSWIPSPLALRFHCSLGCQRTHPSLPSMNSARQMFTGAPSPSTPLQLWPTVQDLSEELSPTSARSYLKEGLFTPPSLILLLHLITRLFSTFCLFLGIHIHLLQCSHPSNVPSTPDVLRTCAKLRVERQKSAVLHCELSGVNSVFSLLQAVIRLVGRWT